MMIQRELKIRDKKSLQLAIGQLKKNRALESKLLLHNVDAVTSKWSIGNITSSVVHSIAPKVIGSVSAYASRLLLTSDDESDLEESAAEWRKIIRNLLESLAPTLIQKIV